MNLSYRLALAQDLEAINRFNANQLPVWRHEFFSVLRPQSHLAICEDGDQVVGTEGYVNYPLLLNGEPIMSHRSERTLVSPTYRGKNIFNALIDLCTEATKAHGSLFCWGATAAQKAFERAGFHYRHGYRTYAILPLSSSRYTFKQLLRGRALPLNPLRLYRQLKGRDIKVSKEAITAAAHGRYIFKRGLRAHAVPTLTHVSAPKQWSDVDALHARIRTSETFITLRHDQQLFEWLEGEGQNRFLKVFSYEGDTLRSYLCIHLDEADSYAPVLDFCADSAEALASAIAHARQTIIGHGYTALFFTLNTENAEQRTLLSHLHRLGATNYGRVGTWVIKPLCLADSPIYQNMQAWYLTDLWFALYNRSRL